MSDSNVKELIELLKLPGNSNCNDCGAESEFHFTCSLINLQAIDSAFIVIWFLQCEAHGIGDE